MICSTGVDDFCTNMGSYLDFFEPLITQHLSISLFVFEGNTAHATFSMARILNTIKYMKLGQSLDSAEYRYLKRVAQVGLSKDVLSMAKFNLNQYLQSTATPLLSTLVRQSRILAFLSLTPVSVRWRGWILQEPQSVEARLLRHRNMT